MYEQQTPIINKLLQPDGSVTTFEGALIMPPNEAGAALWASCSPIVNKVLMPDGSVTGLEDVTGGGKGGGAV